MFKEEKWVTAYERITITTKAPNIFSYFCNSSLNTFLAQTNWEKASTYWCLPLCHPRLPPMNSVPSSPQACEFPGHEADNENLIAWSAWKLFLTHSTEPIPPAKSTGSDQMIWPLPRWAMEYMAGLVPQWIVLSWPKTQQVPKTDNGECGQSLLLSVEHSHFHCWHQFRWGNQTVPSSEGCHHTQERSGRGCGRIPHVCSSHGASWGSSSGWPKGKQRSCQRATQHSSLWLWTRWAMIYRSAGHSLTYWF